MAKEREFTPEGKRILMLINQKFGYKPIYEDCRWSN